MRTKEELINAPFAIFDMDGTLIDSLEWLGKCIKDFLDDRKIPYSAGMFGETRNMGDADIVESLFSLLGKKMSPSQIMDEVNKYIRVCYGTCVKLYPYTTEYLELLKSKGVKMCLASATCKSDVELVLGRLDVLKYFDFTISIDDVGKDKDYPDIYIEAAKRLGAALPALVTVYEDSPMAMATARNAGFGVIGINKNPDDCEFSQKTFFNCDLKIKEFNELM